MRASIKPSTKLPTKQLLKLSPQPSSKLLSKPPMTLPRYSFTLIILLLTFATHARAQVTPATTMQTMTPTTMQTTPTTEARIAIISLSPPRVKVEGVRSIASKAWSFRNAYAGIIGLGERIENLSLADARGADVPVRRLAAGEYEAARDAVKFSYEIKLDPPATTNDAAHVSWLTQTRGALMPGDLLPLPLAHARLTFKLPDGWKLASPEKATDTAPQKTNAAPQKTNGASAFETDAAGASEFEDAESAVVFSGQDVRERLVRVNGMDVRVAIAGEWVFTDDEVADVIASIVREHAKMVGVTPRSSALVIVAPPPRRATFNEWSAETRGGTVLYLSGRAPSKVSALARLSPPLAHELFHLWVPNGLGLSGDYDWFYEGFTNYQALRASQRLGFLSFDDYLAALANAYDNYAVLKQQDTASLVEASARRWSGASALVYHKGMLVAALYDLQLRRATKGRRSLDDVYRDLFRRAQQDTRGRDGNAVVLDALKEVAGGKDFAARFVAVAQRIDLSAELSPFGLSVESIGARHQISVADSLSGSQRDLLRQIGYNK
jgi:predicted metalloprotease with PDZ domain